MSPSNLTSFLWGVTLTLILFLVFINKGIENTKRKVDNAFVNGYIARDRELRNVDNCK